MKKCAVLAAFAVTFTALLVLPVVALSVNNGEQHAEPSQNSVVQEKNADQTADLPVCFADSAAVLNPDEKERIVDGMLNSTQYFSTVQGSFPTSLVTGDISAPSTIVYMVDIPGENVYEQLLDDQNDMEVYFAQRQQAQYMNDRKQVIIRYGGAVAPADRMLRNDILQLRETAQNVGVMPDGEMCYL